ncbi:hypothetical protein [Chromobacterium sphagni]|uniref:Uncharacterized protein n=1 Tax=Chromobacterium sphagni TaxID=1903179 RepID=A0A1S1X1G4_9NEIS|nr:hypothetical protein [Chromobacterium sphagni]OHX13362.1 hypothetical protein BI347_07450 [Chromobacterium sphagni]OHX18711.1 hypothetical protein BI344_20165 [Chromobacterium sphagni]
MPALPFKLWFTGAGRPPATAEPSSAETRQVARSAYGYVLRVQTTVRIILPSSRGDETLKRRADELLRKENYTWGELFELEMLCAELASDDMLVLIRPTDVDPSLEYCEAACMAERWGGAADGLAGALAGARGGKPAAGRAELRAAVLLGQQRYFRSLRRERALDRLRLRLGLFTLAMALLGGIYYWWLSGSPTDAGLALSATFGILGAFASVLQRIQSVGEKTSTNGQSGASVAMLMEGSWSLYLALASGAVFGILGFWLFAGGFGGAFLSTQLAPSFSASLASCHDSALPYLQQGSDYGKMAVWAFFFGFAERFIPDLLTQLAKNGAANVPRPQSRRLLAEAGKRSRAAWEARAAEKSRRVAAHRRSEDGDG